MAFLTIAPSTPTEETAACIVCGAGFALPPKRKTSDKRRQTCSRSCAVALAWKNQDSRAKRIASIKAERNTPGAKARAARINRERWARPGEREKLARRNRERWADPSIREAMSAAIRAVQGTPEMRAHYSQMRRRQWAEDQSYRERTVEGIRRSKGSPEARALFSILLKARWRDPARRAKYMTAVRSNSKLAAGVPRPSRRKTNVVDVPVPQFTKDEKRSLERARLAVIRMAKRNRSTDADLAAIAAAYKGPIKKYPSGAHSGWRPSWMSE